jgi:hypothetical protein
VPENLLFQKKDIYLFVEEQQQRIRQAYEGLSDEQALDEGVIERLKKQFNLDVPVLQREKRTYDDHPPSPGGAGVEFVFYVPFEGDPKVFDIAPSAQDGKIVRGKVAGQELLLRFVVQNSSVRVEELLDRELAVVELRLYHLRGSTEYLEQQLNITLSNCKVARRRVIEERARIAALKPNIPRRVAPISAPTPEPAILRASDVPNRLTKSDDVHWDVFISHASEDKVYVEEFAAALRENSISVWLDSLVLKWGSSLREAIDNGLKRSRFVIVVLSKAFLAKKKWTEYELSSAFAIETVNEKRILPIWHRIVHADLREYSPGLTDRLARETDKHSFEEIARELLVLLGRSGSGVAAPHPATAAREVKESTVAKFQKGEVAAYAWYESASGQRVQLYVHKAATGDRFVFEDSRGEIIEGMLADIATKYALADRTLRVGAFGRTTLFNGAYPEFRL